MKPSVFFKVLLIALVAFGCGESDINPNVKKFQIFLDYWNTTGRNPEIIFDQTNTSKEVKIDFTKTFEGQTEGNVLSKVIIDNFKIIDNQSADYEINNIKAFEYRMDSKDWREDVEFTMDYSRTQDIGVVVLVLDRSNSLGDDFDRIKQYASNFIEQTFKEHPDVKMGIVDFSTTVSNMPITNDKAALIKYIQKLESDKFTALYEAMDMGIDMLLKDPAQSRVLVTFTDGADNMSDGYKFTLDNVFNRIKGDKRSEKIRGFFIGLEGKGNFDANIANTLANNGWVVNIPKNAGEVEDVFNKFGRLISNYYNLTYIRNQQIVPSTQKIKLKFEITASK